MYYRECVVCGADFTTSSVSCTTCSKRCLYERRRAMAQDAYTAKAKTLAQEDGPRKPTFTPDGKIICVVCGAAFIPKKGAYTCSPACRRIYKEMYKAAYHARRRLVSVPFEDDALDVYVDARVHGILDGACPYALGLLPSDARYVPVL